MSGIKNLPLLSHVALDLDELGDQLAGADEAGDGGALGVEPEWPCRLVETR